ncbi:hypothetical protein O7632_25720 [Solwaraspora sp. WMMD406]|uniref:hypothetical protein n=1 Tax=Solwaraspora sp. WMMD406 TaxID=3016095 RepID=UPI00241609F7|nr:hypothetical protein [Solwaraspora sp. WMMD406]MDG4767463.1 hypothetical protein [Solwaraspora sp. WMMD406]
MAPAHVQSGAPEQAGAVGVQAAQAAESLSSERARAYLAILADRLTPYAGLPTVQELSARVRPLLQAA